MCSQTAVLMFRLIFFQVEMDIKDDIYKSFPDYVQSTCRKLFKVSGRVAFIQFNPS